MLKISIFFFIVSTVLAVNGANLPQEYYKRKKRIMQDSLIGKWFIPNLSFKERRRTYFSLIELLDSLPENRAVLKERDLFRMMSNYYIPLTEYNKNYRKAYRDDFIKCSSKKRKYHKIIRRWILEFEYLRYKNAGVNEINSKEIVKGLSLLSSSEQILWTKGYKICIDLFKRKIINSIFANKFLYKLYSQKHKQKILYFYKKFFHKIPKKEMARPEYAMLCLSIWKTLDNKQAQKSFSLNLLDRMLKNPAVFSEYKDAPDWALQYLGWIGNYDPLYEDKDTRIKMMRLVKQYPFMVFQYWGRKKFNITVKKYQKSDNKKLQKLANSIVEIVERAKKIPIEQQLYRGSKEKN